MYMQFSSQQLTIQLSFYTVKWKLLRRELPYTCTVPVVRTVRAWQRHGLLLRNIRFSRLWLGNAVLTSLCIVQQSSSSDAAAVQSEFLTPTITLTQPKEVDINTAYVHFKDSPHTTYLTSSLKKKNPESLYLDSSSRAREVQGGHSHLPVLQWTQLTTQYNSTVCF